MSLETTTESLGAAKDLETDTEPLETTTGSLTTNLASGKNYRTLETFTEGSESTVGPMKTLDSLGITARPLGTAFRASVALESSVCTPLQVHNLGNGTRNASTPSLSISQAHQSLG